jgi:3-isopropylmalate/(R)-2-methylmalate dehydratase small subunit
LTEIRPWPKSSVNRNLCQHKLFRPSPRNIITDVQGLLGIAGLKMGLVVESIPRGSLRNAVNAGLPILPACPDVTKHCETGDELEVDFATGRFTNLTQGKTLQFEPLDAQLRDIVALGGQRPALQKRIAEMMASRG